ncbi:lytic murein transglycosylase [Blastochloris viridis]|uniref:Membrane-bound lytic murein transglycosylase B n=1 Tax=Blastochloris viridis TaxID=1079 RepID=A0A0H5BDK4_BLAVI|nr:lytic murein transglycosylase [Blastochloris viridis]ALK08329.1 Membrane-bound lytic murein transglycosylase B precursor [Blastochloris viridis]BAR98401.1 membrane-bound lytic murein transglycosylase B precursor [Blastochloris viridis]CUU44251.1 Membrane-bound lytic murein transglycosylase B precursor [Blastochloris viridis]
MRRTSTKRRSTGFSLVVAAVAALIAAPAAATPAAAPASVPCRTSGSFESWLEGVKAEARAAGVANSAIEAALAGVTYDPAIIRRDQGQGVFQQTFLTFSDRMVSSDRMVRGRKYLGQYAGVLSRIEAQYGVPGAVLVAFWGLETDFGSDLGKYRAPAAVATLAYDCRRADYFRPELIDLLRIVARGDLKPSEMVGDWAGELGHLMFTPTDLYRYAADGDGDGHINVMRSVPDSFATGANFLRGLGWRRGEPWLEEVAVPADMDWSQADLDTMLPRAAWSRMGVRTPAGTALAVGGPPAALLLPMGRNGPAFLAYPNFKVYLGWNKAMVYSTTAAYYATRLAGAPQVSRGRDPVTPLSTEQMRHLQALLQRASFTRDAPDGRFGQGTRAAVRAAQIALGLPADGYPSTELIAALERRR